MRKYKPALYKRLIIMLSVQAIVLSCGQIYSQETPQIILPSPEAVSLFKFQEYPVDYSTGVPAVNIDLYNIDMGAINIPITMNYHASGRKVNDQDGPLSLNWNLNTGGTISKTVYGSDDFGQYPFPSPFKTTNLDNRNYYTYFEKIVHYLKNSLIVNNGNWKDSEYDIFSYILGEKNGKFIFKDSNGVKIPALLPYEPIIIKPVTSQNKLNGFKIIDDKGYYYNFILTGSYYDNKGLVINNNFQVKQIVSPDKTDTITFNYGQGVTQKRITINQSITINDQVEGANLSPTKRTDNEQTKTDYYNLSYITEIRFNKGKIRFTYDDANKIDNIYITDSKNNSIRTIQFRYSSLDASPETFNYTHKLDSILFKGSNGVLVNKYKFEYYPTQSTINTRYRDWWGYYNNSGIHDLIPQYSIQYIGMGNGTEDYLIGNSAANRNPRIQGLLAGTLKKVYYPTGGSAEFIYENNKYYDAGTQSVKLGPGIRVNQINYNDGNGNSSIKTYHYGNNENGYGSIDLTPDVKNMAEESHYYYLPNNIDPNPYSMTTTTYRQRVFMSDFQGNLQELANRPIIYTTVTEYNGTETDNNGKLILKYTNPSWNYSSLQTQQMLTIPRRHIYQFNYWDKPELISKSEYSNLSNNILPYELKKETVYAYLDSITSYASGLHVQTINIFPQNYAVADPTPPPLWSEPWAVERGSTPMNQPYGYAEYIIPIGIHKLSSTGTILYNSNNLKITSSEEFNYNKKGLLSQKIENSSTDKTIKTIYKYPFEYPSESILNMMGSDSVNMINYVIEESKFKGNTFIMGRKTNYANWDSQNRQIYAQSINQKMGTSPYLQEIAFNSYDKNGNITSVFQRTQGPICYVWSYNGQYPIAKIDNIEYSTLISLLGGAGKIETFSNRSPTLEEINIFLQPVLDYSQNKDIVINRYSYLPFGNMTANINPRGSATYYDYDNFQRLRTIKDNDKNSLKALSFNSIDSLGTADSIYFSSYKSGTFTKNNCSVGLYGTSVTYRVPAKKYTSYLSQSAADSMALSEVNNFGQEYANNNGECFYYNTMVEQTFTRNNCSLGVNGSAVTYTVPAKKYYSFTSQQDANSKAETELIEFGQQSANTNGTCGFKNVEKSTYLSRNNCPSNSISVPTTITYTVAAGKYYSPISQSEADSMATNDINQNAQNYANAHCDCKQLVTFSFTNQTSDEFGVSISDGTDYQLSVHAKPGTSSIQIPVGIYSISVSVIGSSNQHNIYVGNRTSVKGSSVTFTNVNVSSGSPNENKIGMF